MNKIPRLITLVAVGTVAVVAVARFRRVSFLDLIQGQRGPNVTKLYKDNCASCHGDKAQGTAVAKSLLSEEKFEQTHDRPFFETIKNGVKDKGMPAFGSMPAEHVWALVVHIRELQRAALAEKWPGPPAEGATVRTKLESFKMETVVGDGLDTPWSLDWLPDGQMLVTNKPGSLVIVRDGKITGRVAGLPPMVDYGQGGLMEVAVHPQYATNGWIYLSFADSSSGGVMTKVVRGKLELRGNEARFVNHQTIYQGSAESYTRDGVHFGGKIVFDGKGHMFVSIGERGTNMRAQETGTPYGKVMRLNEDGTIPNDNPIAGNPMWTYGHRNPQGLAFDGEGRLWDTEHGPRGGDELNLLEPGKNYGWPVVAFSINYQDTPFQVPWPKPGQDITLPVLRWIPSIAPSGLALVTGAAFPKWKGDLLAGGLAGNVLVRIRVSGGKLVEKEDLLHRIGRVRDIAVATDGTVYLALNGPDKIVRLVPAR